MQHFVCIAGVLARPITVPGGEPVEQTSVDLDYEQHFALFALKGEFLRGLVQRASVDAVPDVNDACNAYFLHQIQLAANRPRVSRYVVDPWERVRGRSPPAIDVSVDLGILGHSKFKIHNHGSPQDVNYYAD